MVSPFFKRDDPQDSRDGFSRAHNLSPEANTATWLRVAPQWITDYSNAPSRINLGPLIALAAT